MSVDHWNSVQSYLERHGHLPSDTAAPCRHCFDESQGISGPLAKRLAEAEKERDELIDIAAKDAGHAAEYASQLASAEAALRECVAMQTWNPARAYLAAKDSTEAEDPGARSPDQTTVASATSASVDPRDEMTGECEQADRFGVECGLPRPCPMHQHTVDEYRTRAEAAEAKLKDAVAAEHARTRMENARALEAEARVKELEGALREARDVLRIAVSANVEDVPGFNVDDHVTIKRLSALLATKAPR